MIAKTKMNVIWIILLAATITSFGQTKSGPSNVNNKTKNTKRILFIAGTDSHGKGEHEHNGGTTILANGLKKAIPEIDTVVCHNGWPKDPSVFKGVDAIVIYCDGGGDHIIISHLKEIDSLAKTGVGISMIHFTLEIPKENGGEYLLKWIGGYFETDWSVNPVWTANFETFPNHPIINGVKPFALKDEWYYHMRFVNGTKNITSILKVLPPDSTLNRPEGTHSGNPTVKEEVWVKKEPQTIAWAYDRPDGGRGFGFTGGHVHANWGNDNFRKLVLNAIAWTAKIELPANGIQTETPSPAELDRLSKQTK